MRISSLACLSAMLFLSACVTQQSEPAIPFASGGYAYLGQPQADDEPDYAADESYLGSDGLTYVGETPVTMLDGTQVPVVYDSGAGGWGYYDRFRHFHGVPRDLRDRLERTHPGGRGLPPPGHVLGQPAGLAPGAFRSGLGVPSLNIVHGGLAVPPAPAFHTGPSVPVLGGLHGGPGQLAEAQVGGRAAGPAAIP
jgi:hypothetical protein